MCEGNAFAADCVWLVERGTTVELTATPTDGAGNSFAGWSDEACGAGPSCTLRVDDETASIVALFSPLRLGVFFSGDAGGATIRAEPEGAPCSDAVGGEEFCREYPARTAVRLTLTPGTTAFRGWNDGERTTCEPATAATCTVIVADEPTSIGARFDDDQPQLPPTISVEFKLRKSGDGRGRVTADKLDCGTVCSAKLGFGKRLTLVAAPEAGSYFGGWGGVCAATDTTCALPAGPVTSVSAVFTRDGTPPTTPARLRALRRTRTTVTLAWSGSRDNVAVARYRVYRGRAALAETPRPRYTVRKLRCGRRYALGVEAVDVNGNRSARATTRVRTKPCARASRR